MKPDTSSFVHSLVIPVRYDDIDTMGHVNNKAYIGFLEESRIDYYMHIQNLDRRTLRFATVVRRIEVQYDAPTFFGDTVRVYSRCVRIGRSSIDFEQLIMRRGPDDQNETIAARAAATIVAIDESHSRPVPVPDEVREAISQYEVVAPTMGRRAPA